ncbi:hypothetical protein M441DRAFT_44512 [Trichoderma asperellum CBS 433.97]|uniref:Uncharacterized protein n=1 Tax=Trichoderma asperellum (strain ATCC 204424 / CBS 433.97 / NBRC 101777) TaxID=1042311 RepID=A0A2T3ZI57_TRIA4|nr:hypothetical protein M441DRAFT_44512 [Trichoderma asperellum CBS 433.97]PTB44453.1 hypothetical protein M441DRAFT_44512 [Trichoderma asperellum CBS 433.97]
MTQPLLKRDKASWTGTTRITYLIHAFSISVHRRMEFKIECYHQSELDKLRGQPHFRGLTQLEPVTFGGNMTSEEFDLRRRHGGGEDPYAGNVDENDNKKGGRKLFPRGKALLAWRDAGQELPAADLCSTQCLDSGTNYVGGGTHGTQRRYMLQVEAGTADPSVPAVNLHLMYFDVSAISHHHHCTFFPMERDNNACRANTVK